MNGPVLRSYQLEAVERTLAAHARGVRRQLGVAATGLGKSAIFTSLARRMAVRTLILVHRDELAAQAVRHVQDWWPEADCGVVKAERDEVNATVVIASIQTLARPRRLARLLAPTTTLLGELAPFGLVIADEAHHCGAKSWQSVLHGLRCGEDDGPLLLGVTATPDRGDGKGLDDVFDEITWSYDIRWGIAHQYLADLRGLRIQLDSDLSKLGTRGGDYDAGEAGRMLEDADAPDLIAQAWIEHAPNRRTVVFVPTIATARQTAAAFTARGLRAAAVWGDMPLDERRALLASYRAGELDVLANAMLLTEGWDDPRTDCIVWARPTKSRALYAQAIGRGARVHPEKQDCLVVDVVGSTEQHDLVTIPSLFGIEHARDVWGDREGGMTVTDALRAQVERHEHEGRLVAAEARLFDQVRTQSRMAWVAGHDPGGRRRYELSIGSGGLLVLVERDDGWRAGHRAGGHDGAKRVLVNAVSLEMAQGVAEDECRRLGVSSLVNLDAAWRQARPSRKQRDLAKKLHVTLPTGCTKGEASDLLGAAMARRHATRTG